ncbi:MAG TPA: PadR family transcriptional regulator [Acidimicrobiia bacterium]|nr:PadR family transcriptional regulator [Acidimicrobiia bacterium]
MSRPRQEMTTTTYAVLGLLCVRPWSAYELTQQMARSMRFMWPRAESGIYREPQKLVALGHASVRDVAAGPRRTKQVYSATPSGRRALRRWLRAPSAPPQFESEALVKFFFADRGAPDDAKRMLDELASHGEALQDAFRAITASYADGPGPFPERLHIGSLIGRFLFEYSRALVEWSAWAREHVDDWPETGPAAARLGHAVQEENARLAGIAGRAHRT